MKVLLFLAIAVLCVCEGRHVGESKRSTRAHFDVHVEEHGTKYVEHVKMDFENNLQVINVPTHNGVNAMNEMNDFNNGRSVMCLPDRKLCYLLELEKELYDELANQEQSMLSWWRKNGVHVADTDEDAVIIPRNWIRTDGPLETLAFLSKKMQKFIGDLPVYRLERLPEDAELLLDDGENAREVNVSSRSKRSDIIPMAMTRQISCEGSGIAYPKYGFTGTAATTCDWLIWCENPNDLTDCKERHKGNYIFYRCMCCPEHKRAEDCDFCHNPYE